MVTTAQSPSRTNDRLSITATSPWQIFFPDIPSSVTRKALTDLGERSPRRKSGKQNGDACHGSGSKPFEGASSHCTSNEDGETTSLRSEGTRLNSSHLVISYAVFCLKKK